MRDELRKKFDYKNVNQIPKFEKIVVNMGVGESAATASCPDKSPWTASCRPRRKRVSSANNENDSIYEVIRNARKTFNIEYNGRAAKGDGKFALLIH